MMAIFVHQFPLPKPRKEKKDRLLHISLCKPTTIYVGLGT